LFALGLVLLAVTILVNIAAQLMLRSMGGGGKVQ
jgi:ABC-type phosphate transport system permease subunit